MDRLAAIDRSRRAESHAAPRVIARSAATKRSLCRPSRLARSRSSALLLHRQRRGVDGRHATRAAHEPATPSPREIASTPRFTQGTAFPLPLIECGDCRDGSRRAKSPPHPMTGEYSHRCRRNRFSQAAWQTARWDNPAKNADDAAYYPATVPGEQSIALIQINAPDCGPTRRRAVHGGPPPAAQTEQRRPHEAMQRSGARRKDRYEHWNNISLTRERHNGVTGREGLQSGPVPVLMPL
jgi:hypothetical protein